MLCRISSINSIIHLDTTSLFHSLTLCQTNQEDDCEAQSLWQGGWHHGHFRAFRQWCIRLLYLFWVEGRDCMRVAFLSRNGPLVWTYFHFSWNQCPLEYLDEMILPTWWMASPYVSFVSVKAPGRGTISFENMQNVARIIGAKECLVESCLSQGMLEIESR